ncbi:DUF3952 domain-containing protein [Fictibacillus sp. Mic-4]|uniref:DUF3952 domain-containing protein n=1 Tax=Fictibacillus sp. Mic-4 TaxID=3132826 RepID=UPI003CEFAD3C
MKKVFFILLLSAVISLLSGCLFIKEIDYHAIAKDLNEKNMTSIMRAKNGHSEYHQDAYVITSSPAEKNQIKKETDEIYFEGIYNTAINSAAGKAVKSFDVSIEKGNEEKQIKEESSKEFKVRYANNQYVNQETNKTLNLQFMLDKLQGIEKVKPKHYEYGLDEPPSLAYNLNEQEFNKIINDDLKIDYDKFKGALISIRLQEDKPKRLFITDISVSVEWQKKNKKGQWIDYFYDNTVDLN